MKKLKNPSVLDIVLRNKNLRSLHRSLTDMFVAQYIYTLPAPIAKHIRERVPSRVNKFRKIPLDNMCNATFEFPSKYKLQYGFITRKTYIKTILDLPYNEENKKLKKNTSAACYLYTYDDPTKPPIVGFYVIKKEPVPVILSEALIQLKQLLYNIDHEFVHLIQFVSKYGSGKKDKWSDVYPNERLEHKAYSDGFIRMLKSHIEYALDADLQEFLNDKDNHNSFQLFIKAIIGDLKDMGADEMLIRHIVTDLFRYARNRSIEFSSEKDFLKKARFMGLPA